MSCLKFSLLFGLIFLACFSAHAQPIDTLWTRHYIGGASLYGRTMIQTTDGGFLLVGSRDIDGMLFVDVLVIKTNSNGDTLWTRAFHSDSGSFCSAMFEVENGYVLAGSTWHQSDDTTYVSNGWLFKIGSNGNTLESCFYRG